MAFFSEAGLVASGTREKMRLCPKCGLSLEYIDGYGYCCPKGHGCWFPPGEQKVIREPPDAIYAGGAIEFKGGSKSGKKRKKPPKIEKVNIFDRP